MLASAHSPRRSDCSVSGAGLFAGQIPTILKLNSATSLNPDEAPKDQAVTGSVKDALRLGCAAIGFTIYPGSSALFGMIEELRALSEEAKLYGLAVVVWSYARGEALSKAGETAVDITAYAAQIAALLGAHIIKLKLPTDHIEQAAAKKAYEAGRTDVSSPTKRVAHIMRAAFAARRIVVFSGGAAKGEDAVYDDAVAIRDGGGNGSIIGRNTFQRPRAEALAMLDRVVAIYRGEVLT